MKTPESPLDLDSLLNTATEPATDQQKHPFAPASPSVFGSPVMETPGQVAENRWDSEEILEIPRVSPTAEMANPLAVEDLLSVTPMQGEILEPYADYPAPEIGQATQAGRGNEEYPYQGNILAVEQGTDEVLEHDDEESLIHSQAALTDAATTETVTSLPAKPSVFAQDSYVRSPSNTYVMAQPDQSNKGRLAKVFLAAALLCALLGVGYFALSGLIKDWLGAQKQVVSNPPVPSATTATTTASTSNSTPGNTAATPGNKNAAASPSAAASPTASTSTKPSPSAAATAPPGSATSTTNQTAQTTTNKPTPTPTTTTGTSGHSVGTGDGSLAIQLASYKSSGEAQRTIARLKSAGVDARIVKAEVAGKGTWFRVQAGRFTNEGEAAKYAGDLRAKGVTRDFIVTGYQNQ